MKQVSAQQNSKVPAARVPVLLPVLYLSNKPATGLSLKSSGK